MTDRLSHRAALLSAVLVAGLTFGSPAFAQTKSIDDSLGGEKSEEIKPEKKQDGAKVKPEGDGAKIKPEGDGAQVKPEDGAVPGRPAQGVRSATNPNCDPTFGGRYVNLVRKIYMPRDRRQYGTCRNYGRWNGTSYRGHRFPRGLFWTFDGTHWYLFASRRTAAGIRSTTNPNCDPTFGGRYASLVRKIYMPRDRRQYGMCRNYGPWNGTSYRGHRFPRGLFWTFDGTHWYLFARRVR